MSKTLSNVIIIWKTEIRKKKNYIFLILFKYNIFLFKQLIFHFLKFALSLKKKKRFRASLQFNTRFFLKNKKIYEQYNFSLLYTSIF